MSRDTPRIPEYLGHILGGAFRGCCGVNLEQGYKPVSIYSPREVVSYGKED